MFIIIYYTQYNKMFNIFRLIVSYLYHEYIHTDTVRQY